MRGPWKGGPRAHTWAGSRVILFLASAVLTSIAGFIIVRKLDPTGYAAYQSFTKRVIQYVAALTVFYEMWLYQQLARRDPWVRCTVKAYAVLAGLVGGITGLGMVYWISGDPLAGLLALAAGLLFGVRSPYMLTLDSYRALKAPLTRVLYRLSYFALVALLVYALLLGLRGALAANLLALAIALYATLRFLWQVGEWRGLPGCRESGGLLGSLRRAWNAGMVKASSARTAHYLAANLDVPLVYSLTGSTQVISGFFAARLIPFTLYDVMKNTYRFLYSRLLRGHPVELGLRGIVVAVALLAPIPAFTLVNPVHTLYLLNPEYAWASRVLQVFSVEIVILMIVIGLEYTLLGLAGRVDGSEEGLYRTAYTLLVATGALYLLTLALALPTIEDRSGQGLAWAVASLLYATLQLAVYTGFLHRSGLLHARIILEKAIAPSLLLLAGATLAASLIPVRGAPRTWFWGELTLILESAIPLYLAWTGLMALLFPELRREARAIAARILRRAGHRGP